jgi:hypothetical protein
VTIAQSPCGDADSKRLPATPSNENRPTRCAAESSASVASARRLPVGRRQEHTTFLSTVNRNAQGVRGPWPFCPSLAGSFAPPCSTSLGSGPTPKR